MPRKIRKFKGKSLAKDLAEYTVIDIETTGLSTEYDEIIEIGALKIKDGQVIDSYSQLVKPKYRIDEFITKLTGITNEMVADKPKFIDIGMDFVNFIGNSILLGQNVNFDINFLYDRIYRDLNMHLENDFVDILRFSRKLFPELKNRKLKTVAKHLNIESITSHRAIADCEVTYKCYEEQLKIIKNMETTPELLFKKKHSHTLDAKDIVATTNQFDQNHILYNSVCAFTGKLEKMPRKEAMQLVVNIGGKCGNSLTKSTNFLIVGNFDYWSGIKNGKSSKQKKAEKYILEGQDLKVIPEDVFYDMVLGESDHNNL